jgi:hypothetical protein
MVRYRGEGGRSGRSSRRKDRVQKLRYQSKIGLAVQKKASCTQRKGFDGAKNTKNTIKDIKKPIFKGVEMIGKDRTHLWREAVQKSSYQSKIGPDVQKKASCAQR